MNFDVSWLPDAENRLAAIYLDSPDPKSVTLAANQIDRLLEYAPQNQGESREGDVRIMFCEPLGVLYRLNAQKSEVYVIDVWSY